MRQADLREFLEVFAAWDAAYRSERSTVERLYRAKLQLPADEEAVRRLLGELAQRRGVSDESLALLAAHFEEVDHGHELG